MTLSVKLQFWVYGRGWGFTPIRNHWHFELIFSGFRFLMGWNHNPNALSNCEQFPQNETPYDSCLYRYHSLCDGASFLC